MITWSDGSLFSPTSRLLGYGAASDVKLEHLQHITVQQGWVTAACACQAGLMQACTKHSRKACSLVKRASVPPPIPAKSTYAILGYGMVQVTPLHELRDQHCLLPLHARNQRLQPLLPFLYPINFYWSCCPMQARNATAA